MPDEESLKPQLHKSAETDATRRETEIALKCLTGKIVACRSCSRLVEHRELIGEKKRASYLDWDYWARPVPSFGDPMAPLLVLGLAPAAHGGNRTGRVFTGDASATFLVKAMHAAGLANQPVSDHRDDGLEYEGAYICAAVRCVPPGDRPTPEEQRTCLPYLVSEMRLLPHLKVVMALGQIAFQAALRAMSNLTIGPDEKKKPLRAKFAHGGVFRFEDDLPLLMACYHPSPRNTNTGRLTMEQLVEAMRTAKHLAEEEQVRRFGRA